jgi:hypothetical protein
MLKSILSASKSSLELNVLFLQSDIFLTLVQTHSRLNSIVIGNNSNNNNAVVNASTSTALSTSNSSSTTTSPVTSPNTSSAKKGITQGSSSASVSTTLTPSSSSSSLNNGNLNVFISAADIQKITSFISEISVESMMLTIDQSSIIYAIKTSNTIFFNVKINITI